MIKRSFKKVSGPYLVAFMALFIALSGTAGASGIVRLITGSQIKTGTITSRNIKAHTITGRDVRNGSLQATAFSAAAIQKLEGANGATGPQGVGGVTGATGVTGAIGQAGSAGSPGGSGGSTALQTFDATGSALNYVTGAMIAALTLPAPGVYIVSFEGTATNTSPSFSSLGCDLLDTDGALVASGIVNVLPLITAPIKSNGGIEVTTTTSETETLQCSSAATFDVAFTVEAVKLTS